METVQKLVPFFEELLQHWYQLTLHNREYAISLALSVWLLTAIFYSIRIGFLKRNIIQANQAKQQTQEGLEQANQQIEALRQQLAEAEEAKLAAEQTAQAESQRASGFESRLNGSKRLVADSLVNLVDCFELNLHNLPAADAENLLPEFEAVIARVAERFRSEQQAKTQLQLSLHAESAKLAEKDMLIASLENRLDTQTQQLVKLELAVEQYETAQKQLERDRQQQAIQLQQRQAEEKPAAPAPLPAQAPIQAEVKPAPVFDKQPEIVAAAPANQVQPAPVAAKPQTVVSESAKKPAALTAKPAPADKMKGLFGRAMDKFSKLDEKLGSPGKPGSAAEKVEEEPVAAPQVTAAEPELPAAAAENKQRESGLNDKLSGLFGGFKKSAATKPAGVEIEPVAAEPVEENTPAPAGAAVGQDKKVTGQLSGLFDKFKSKK